MAEFARGTQRVVLDGFIDVSVPFDTTTPPWPGDTPFTCGWAWEMSAGASVNVSRWESSPHVGTHADAPLHVRADGAGADRLSLAAFIGTAQVVQVVAKPDTEITVDALLAAGWRRGCQRLILKTGRSVAEGTWPETWPALAEDAARTLVSDGLRLLAVDCPSVDLASSKSLAVHHALFDGDGSVLENLDLRAVGPGPCDLLALPLRTGAVDAAPVRALLRPVAES